MTDTPEENKARADQRKRDEEWRRKQAEADAWEVERREGIRAEWARQEEEHAAYMAGSRVDIAYNAAEEARRLEDKRDHFASSVLNGWVQGGFQPGEPELTVAQRAYRWADAMMEARRK